MDTARILYESGDDYAEAARLVKGEMLDGYYDNITMLADIYYRNLDGAGRSPMAAAELYILAADMGDGDALSFVHSVDPELINPDIPAKIRSQLLCDQFGMWRSPE